MQFIGIIPARYQSTRFPGKPLVDIMGKPMIQRVWEQASKVLSMIVVATDDSRIYDCVCAFGGRAVMTSPLHRCGTDRIEEAYTILRQEHPEWKDEDTIVVNIQGDEPFIQPAQIQALQSCFETHPDRMPAQIATLVKPFTQEDTLADLENPNTPKVVVSPQGEALYFSRSVVPYLRGIDRSEWLRKGSFYRHIGMYAYRADILARITKMPQTPLELSESLEQLRWLENGLKIRVAVCETYSMGIDTPEDLQQAIEYIRKKENR